MRSRSLHTRRRNREIGPQCGFASTVAGNPLEEDERAKLALVVQAGNNKLLVAHPDTSIVS